PFAGLASALLLVALYFRPAAERCGQRAPRRPVGLIVAAAGHTPAVAILVFCHRRSLDGSCHRAVALASVAPSGGAAAAASRRYPVCCSCRLGLQPACSNCGQLRCAGAQFCSRLHGTGVGSSCGASIAPSPLIIIIIII